MQPTTLGPIDFYYQILAAIENRLHEILSVRLVATDPANPVTQKELDATLRTLKSALDVRHKIQRFEKSSGQNPSGRITGSDSNTQPKPRRTRHSAPPPTSRSYPEPQFDDVTSGMEDDHDSYLRSKYMTDSHSGFRSDLNPNSDSDSDSDSDFNSDSDFGSGRYADREFDSLNTNPCPPPRRIPAANPAFATSPRHKIVHKGRIFTRSPAPA